MSERWDWEIFEEFTKLRDSLRAAKREKNYQQVLSLGLSILELDKSAGFLKIVTATFLKDMAEACIRLDDKDSAVRYLKESRDQFKKMQLIRPGYWQKDIEMIDRKLEKLEGKK